MGNLGSNMKDETAHSRTLSSPEIEGVAKLIKSGEITKIVMMTGAGISTSSGIPDFRSPETGLYANLARLNLPYAEAVFDISYFRKNPEPFYTLAHELYPGRYRPTITHSFIRLLSDKGLLLKHFTQNVDCLDREAGVPADKIMEAHGSFAHQRCIQCKTEATDEVMQAAIKQKKPLHCQKKNCGGLVKPDIVFFGEALPAEFFRCRQLPGQADLCIVMGTSLQVQPFASLPSMVREGVPRILFNKEQVGALGSRPNDILELGECDDGVRKLASACGWIDELEALWAKTAPERTVSKHRPEPRTKDEAVNDEVEKLTREIGKTLKLSTDHTSADDRAVSKENLIKEGDALGHVFPHLRKPAL